MKTGHSYSAKGVLAALGRSALYQLFFVAVQVLLPFVYGIGIAADAAINRGADLAQGAQPVACLLSTSDAADERSSVEVGGGRVVDKKRAK